MYVVSVPYWIVMGKRKPKKVYLNLNWYRNAHFQLLNKAKEVFHDLCKDRLQGIPLLPEVALIYTLYPKTLQLCDTANVCCIVDKFFCDSLVGWGKIPDDNYQIVKGVDFRFGGVDKSNPRVEVTIIPMETNSGSTVHTTQQKESNMQLTLVQTEIEEALRQYVTNQVAVKDGKRIDITLRATRGAEGYQAIIDIVNNDSPNSGDSAGSQASPSVSTAQTSTGPQAEPEVASATVNNEDRSSEATESKGGKKLFGNVTEPVNPA